MLMPAAGDHQQSRLRRLFAAGDGLPDAELLAKGADCRPSSDRHHGHGDAAGGGDHQPARTTPDAGTARQPVAVFSDITRVSDVVNFPTKDASKDSFTAIMG